MPTRKEVDLEKERVRAHKPAAGYPVKKPRRDPVVEQVDKQVKKEKKHPAQR